MRVLRIIVLFAMAAAFTVGCGVQNAPPKRTAEKPLTTAKAAPEKPVQKQTPAKQAPAEKAPAVKAPVEKRPAEKAPVAKAPAAKAPEKKKAPPAADPNVRLSRDFVELPPDEWDGVYFPGVSRVKFPGGAAFTLWSSGIGPQILGVNSDASKISAIRIEVTARRTKDGKNSTPVTLSGLKAVWAPPEADTAKDPFAKCAPVAFEVKDPAQPNVWTATLKGAQNWKGKIARMGVIVELPKPLKARGQDRYLVVVGKIELLK